MGELFPITTRHFNRNRKDKIPERQFTTLFN